MPKRKDIQSILIIGAGPIIIGQACEFDYSGAQACKALQEEGFRVILVNSNPATIMTDPDMADAVYIEPITWRTVAKIIEKEKPDALLPTMGGQTALNCALDLVREGVLEAHGVEMVGASREAIDKAEDRDLFRQAMRKIGLDMPRSAIAHSLEEAHQVGIGPVAGSHLVVVRYVVAGILERRDEARVQPYGIHTELAQVVELLNDAGDIADAIAVGVVEALGVDLIEDCVFQPFRSRIRSHGGAL